MLSIFMGYVKVAWKIRIFCTTRFSERYLRLNDFLTISVYTNIIINSILNKENENVLFVLCLPFLYKIFFDRCDAKLVLSIDLNW